MEVTVLGTSEAHDRTCHTFLSRTCLLSLSPLLFKWSDRVGKVKALRKLKFISRLNKCCCFHSTSQSPPHSPYGSPFTVRKLKLLHQTPEMGQK